MEFLPISSYGFIGNLSSCALVGTNGSMDWCCLPQLDSPSVFGALLDPEHGGRFLIAPALPPEESEQQYLPDTNVLRTEFRVTTGRLEVLDWMHMGGFSFAEEEQHQLPVIYRHIRCTEGRVDTKIVFDPRLNYGRTETCLARSRTGVTAEGGGECLRLHAPCTFTLRERGAEAIVALTEGEELTFLCSYGAAGPREFPPPARSLDRTTDYWRRWVQECEQGVCHVPGRWREQVNRSALALRILAGGRGIAAAATTSLPEIMGGSANWDYRFNWLRDTSFTVQALTAIGHLQDAREFLDWICEILRTAGRRPADLQVLYPLHGPTLHPEEELTHLRGYRDSRPVRIGNAAATQRQLDVYGEILETVWLSEYLHPGVEHALSGVLQDIVDYVCEVWQEPDHGIWELREEPRHYTYSKVMCWVAIDRGIRLAEGHGWEADIGRWKRERETIAAAVLEQGFSDKRKAFVQSFGAETLDATALLFPLLEFLPSDHPKVLSTLDAVQKTLAHGPFVYRTEDHHSKEGTFGLCSFWLVDALALAGRQKEAEENFAALLQHGNHVGLYAEEIDPATGAFLGNFPQAFTHVGLINSALYLSHRGAPPVGEPALMGEEQIE